jgi:hypothetical protein
MRKLTFVLLLISLGCGGCGSPRAYTPLESFPLADGQQWDMRDAAGQLTHFSVTRAPNIQACESGEFYDLRISKTSEEAYWHPGTPRIEVTDWVLKQEQGSWSLATFLVHDLTANFLTTWQLTTKTDWMLNPGKISAGQVSTVSTDLSYWIVTGRDVRTCMQKSEVKAFGPPERMITTERVETVETPVYSGPAVSLDFCEIDLPAPAGGDCNRAHEKWWYAPNLGLVQIEVMPSSNVGPNSDGVTGYVTKRIN